MYHYEIVLNTGTHSWTYKCSTITEAFRAIDEAIGNLNLPLKSQIMDEYMASLVLLEQGSCSAQVSFSYFRLLKVEGEV